MSKNNKKTWTTKYGPRRVRNETPTLAEAIAAAQGLSDEIDEQADIAAALMGLPRDQVHAELLKTAAPQKTANKTFAFTGPASAPRTFVVERKPTRRIIPAANRNSRNASA
ncbi:MAG: hypothetical protein K9G60_08250 [Pseudolabrys sp.]|nr:hypothetical protein [Pseudolabrys sp.]